MAITVYWSYMGDEWMRLKEPTSVRKTFYEKRFHEESNLTEYHKCPFFHNKMNNVYALRSPYDYRFSINNGAVYSSNYNQDFFDRHVTIRSTKNKLFSFYLPFVFFTEEKSLEMSITYPSLEDNNITQRCIMLEGTIDIGKYFRNLDYAFFLKDTFDEFVIDNGEIFEYIKFNTDEKINFQKFIPTEKIKKYLQYVRNAKNNKKFIFHNPQYYYNNFTIKKAVLKEIKENLA